MNTATFEQILEEQGLLVYKTKGVSMRPMLRQDRDLVIIETPASRLKPMDVALYKCGGNYVLHRVIDVENGHYLIRGDNTFALETVPDEAVIGVLTGFQRKGKQTGVENRGYQLYVRVWNAIYPLRASYIRARRMAVKAARKMGVLPLIRKMLGKTE